MKEIKVELTLKYSEQLPWDDVSALSYIKQQLDYKDEIEVASVKKKESCEEASNS